MLRFVDKTVRTYIKIGVAPINLMSGRYSTRATTATSRPDQKPAQPATGPPIEHRIPVILTGRNIDVQDTSLYLTMIGSDVLEERRRGGRWLEEHYKGTQDSFNITQLQGTVLSALADDRRAGRLEVIKNDPKFKIIIRRVATSRSAAASR